MAFSQYRILKHRCFALLSKAQYRCGFQTKAAARTLQQTRDKLFQKPMLPRRFAFTAYALLCLQVTDKVKQNKDCNKADKRYKNPEKGLPLPGPVRCANKVHNAYVLK